jgi:hypothetical protein
MDNVFDELTRVLDELIDWPKRLASEAPFYRGLFDRVGVRRLVDVACGTRRHAALFHSWGLQVQAAYLAGLGDPGPDPLAGDLPL